MVYNLGTGSSMDMEQQIDKFREWLRNNTNLLDGSINLYVRTIKHFFREHQEVNKDNLNKFISDSFRDSNSFYVKYAFKHYLKFINRKSLYEGLVEVKIKPRKKLGTYLPERMIRKIILNIHKDPFMDIALLQYATGARAKEIITLKEEKIDLEFNEKIIRIMLEGKGGKERPVFLSKQFEPILKKYLKGKAGFLFLAESSLYAEEIDIERIVATKRTYLYNELRKSALSLGINSFGTHDFRRNVAEILKRKTGDIRLVQKALGHASIMTTVRYFDDNPEDVKEAMMRHQAEDLND